MGSEFLLALETLEKQKNIKREVILDAIEQAIINAYKKNNKTSDRLSISINQETGDIKIFNTITVVSDDVDYVNDNEMTLEYATQHLKKECKVGDVIQEEIFPEDFGRIAAQTARQIVVQKIKEAEKDIQYLEFKKRETEMITGEISRVSRGTCYVDISVIGDNSNTVTSEGIIPISEQIPGEKYEPGDRFKVYILEVKNLNNKTQIILSRSHPGLVRRLFETEVPEIYEGLVFISNISREAGSRTKIAVYSDDENIDPIGACVGAKGQRVNNIVEEISGEKIDIIEYDNDMIKFISSALSPAKAISVELNEEEKIANVVVPDDKLSLAIGKEGQNARLAAKLTNWKIDIKSLSQVAKTNIGKEEIPEKINDKSVKEE